MTELIQKQTEAAPDAPRLIYGRDNAGQILKPWEVRMNEAALRLLRSNPSLIRFQGSAIKTGPLIEAAKVVISASYVL